MKTTTTRGNTIEQMEPNLQNAHTHLPPFRTISVVCAVVAAKLLVGLFLHRFCCRSFCRSLGRRTDATWRCDEIHDWEEFQAARLVYLLQSERGHRVVAQ